MQPTKSPQNRFVTRRAALLRQMASIGPFVEGTMVKLQRKDCRHVAHRLTFKVQGKTCTVYVPLDRVKDVEAWTKQYKRLKELIRSVTRTSLGELRNHVRSRRASSAGQRSSARRRSDSRGN
ncbi:MAG: DUF6788 family protein [Kiritimatiellia bacterium]